MLSPARALQLTTLSRALSRLWAQLLSLEWLTYSFLFKSTVYLFFAYWACIAGNQLGKLSRTPELASVFDDRNVLLGSVSPQALRCYAWLLLWSSVGAVGYSGWRVCTSITGPEDEDVLDNSTSSISPKLFLPSKGASLPLHDAARSSHDPAHANERASSPLLWTSAIFILFSIAFLARQHIGSTLVYHPADSPILKLAPDITYEPAHDPMRSIHFDSLTRNPMELLDNLPSEHVRRSEEEIVPNIVHFVFGMSEDFGGKPFGFAQFLSIYSAIVETKPGKIMFWYHHLPHSVESGKWWLDRAQYEAAKRGIAFELVRARDFDTVFSRPVTKFAHKADIIRLEALLSHGGIYLDLDVYTLRSYSPFLRFPTVLGLEGGVSPVPRQGLCNGVIVSARNATFVQRWYESYREFDDADWAGLSVKAPLKLAKEHPAELLVMDPFAFFYPLWNKAGLQMVHSRLAELYGEGWDFSTSPQFAYHAWSSFAHGKWLRKLTPDRVWEVETSFTMLLRRWVGSELREEWREAVRLGLVAA